MNKIGRDLNKVKKVPSMNRHLCANKNVTLLQIRILWKIDYMLKEHDNSHHTLWPECGSSCRLHFCWFRTKQAKKLKQIFGTAVTQESFLLTCNSCRIFQLFHNLWWQWWWEIVNKHQMSTKGHTWCKWSTGDRERHASILGWSFLFK